MAARAVNASPCAELGAACPLFTLSPIEYENAQKRILEVFTQWKAPANFKIELFVIRVGDWGGYMLLDCDDPLAVHKFCSMLPAFVFEARPVVPVNDAIRVELEAIAFRDGLKGK